MKKLKAFEKILWIVFCVLGLIVIIGLVVMLTEDNTGFKTVPAPGYSTTDSGNEDGVDEVLADSTIWLPSNCNLYEEIPDIKFTDAEGNSYGYEDFTGKPSVIVFWASWCEDCKEQMPQMQEYMNVSQEYGDVQFIFVNRLDGSKETMESAVEYFDGLGLDVKTYYDEDKESFDALGIKNIPTTLFLDEKGDIASWSAKQIVTTGEFEAHLKQLFQGKGRVTAEFIINNMMDDKGGVHSVYSTGNNEATYESSVLSESQGALMEYSVLTDDKETFDKAFSYVKTNMLIDGLVSWCVEDGEVSNVNALVDDLRIYKALLGADEKWGGYEADLDSFRKAILKYMINKKNYVDFYDTQSNRPADILTLCYIDLVTMQALESEDDGFKKANDNAKEILLNGQISNEFPLYYCRYDYKEDAYVEDELNMAEALVTLLHLAEAGELPEESHEWLVNRMNKGGIMARYDINGNVVEGYKYESTAIYALVVMIADELGDEELRGMALRKMEKMRVTDADLEYNGAFGLEDGSGITSFDQLIPLLAYAELENNK